MKLDSKSAYWEPASKDKLRRQETISFALRPQWQQHRGLNKPERSTHVGQGKAEAWATLTKLLIVRNWYALSSVMLWMLYIFQTEMIQSKYSEEGLKCWEKKAVFSRNQRGVLVITTIHMSPANARSIAETDWRTEVVQNLWWSPESDWQTTLSSSPLACFVCSKNRRTRRSASPDWRVGFLMLLRLRRENLPLPFWRLETLSSGNNKHREDCGTWRPLWTGEVQAHTHT